MPAVQDAWELEPPPAKPERGRKPRGKARSVAAEHADPLQAPEITEVLEHWRSRGYHSRPVADLPDRRARIRERLAEGLDGATLKAALDGASLDDWLMGRDPKSPRIFKGIETLLRDAAQVERLAHTWDCAIAEGTAHPDGGTPTHDRFGNARPKPPPPSPEELAASEQAKREGIAGFEAFQREMREKREAPERERLEAARRAAQAQFDALSPEDQKLLRDTQARMDQRARERAEQHDAGAF